MFGRKKNVLAEVKWTTYVGCWKRAPLPRTDIYTSDQLETLRQYDDDARRRRADRRAGRRRGGRR